MDNQKGKRILNAFVLGTLSTGLLLLIENWQTFIASVQVGDWASLSTLGISLLGGAILAGFRAIQAYITGVPSPEPDENASNKIP